MQRGRLWLLVLAIRGAGVHSDPNPLSALKGDPPNRATPRAQALMQGPLGPAPSPRLRHSERAWCWPNPDSSDCSMRIDCPSPGMHRESPLPLPPPQKMESPRLTAVFAY